MRNIFLCILLLQFSLIAVAQDSENYEDRIEKLEQENQELRNLINEMKSRLDQLEGTSLETIQPEPEQEVPEEAAYPAKVDARPPDEEAIKKVVEEEMDAFELPTWLPSIEGERFRFGGRFQMEYYNPETGGPLRSSLAEQPSGTFGLDEARFYIDADFKEKIRLYTSFDVEEGDTGLTEAFIAFEDIPFNGEMTLGLQDLIYRPSRYTEYYPIPGIAFWRSRDLGIILHNEFDPIYTYLSVMNGLNLEEDNFKEDDSDFILSGDNDDIDLNGEPNVAIGLGLDFELDPWGRFDIMGFGESGKLTDDDTLFLIRELPGYPVSFNKNKNKVGLNLEYKIEEWDFFSQIIAAQDGDLDRLGWYIEGSYKFEIDGWRYLDSIRPLVRYSVLETDIAPNPTANNGSLTWDRQQLTFAIISELTRNVFFRTEYQMNEEDTGGQDVNNNELLLQMEVEF